MDTADGGAACVCAVGYRGATCERENACPRDCSLQGLCVDGVCICAPGFAGSACETELPVPPHGVALAVGRPGAWGRGSPDAGRAGVLSARRCPNRCWGRGACRDGGVCHCEPGFTGDDCSAIVPCDGDCSGRGVCAHGKCHCAPGWVGANCSVALPCGGGGRGRCSDHGVCAHGRCHCDPGYSAADCSAVEAVSERVGLRAPALVGLSAMLAFTALLGGAAVRVSADRRRRARLMRYIEQGGNGQVPFPGEVQSAVGVAPISVG